MFNLKKVLVGVSKKHYCRCVSSDRSSKIIRQQYLDYFVKNYNHSYVRSSPVIPYCDSTIPFVNAGMVQFKGIFLGKTVPTDNRVVNYQKCIRVGGKHNDLSAVGSDGYHHTFFEMLGNWSFGDYFKKEACEMAWELLTGPYRIRPESLYVTYFSGDSQLGLEPDFECKEIWRSIGVPDSNILPFSTAENFWEMGPTGPCGPCTEIHVDRSTDIKNGRAERVNKGYSDLTELWNIVFIQYNKLKTGKIEHLPQCHVDTGMGLERLVALLQNKNSNYDTDLFTPLFEVVHKNCRNVNPYRGSFGRDDSDGIDTAYRILADHARMITVCLSDGVLPEENYKLRRVIRRAMTVSEKVFKKENGLLNEICKSVIDILGDAYPELYRNHKRINDILLYEDEILRALRMDSKSNWNEIVDRYPGLADLIETPSLILGIKEIEALRGTLSSDMAFKLYDTYGLDEETMQILCEEFNLQFDKVGFKTELNKLRQKTKQSKIYNLNAGIAEHLKSLNIPSTDDALKYCYDLKNSSSEHIYEFKPVSAKLLAAIQNGKLVTNIQANVECNLVFDRTCFYYEAGGQEGDKGTVTLNSDLKINVSDVNFIDGYIMHSVVSDVEINVEDVKTVSLNVNPEIKIGLMRNHTATHLLNAALKTVLSDSTIGQKSSRVTAGDLKFTAFVYGKELNVSKIKEIEDLINHAVRDGISVDTKIIDSQTMLKEDDIVLVPGEVYPENGIRLVEINGNSLRSRELCCGTHVKNTEHLSHFCIVYYKRGRCTAEFRAVTGPAATDAFARGRRLLEKIQTFVDSESDPKKIDNSIRELKNVVKKESVPFTIQSECLQILERHGKTVKESVRDSLKILVDAEITSALQEAQERNEPWIVLYLRSSSVMESAPLQRAARVASDLPSLVIAMSDGIVKARCHVPRHFVSSSFDAEKWMTNTVASVFQTRIVALTGQSPQTVCSIKARKIKPDDWDVLLPQALDKANLYAKQCLTSKSVFQNN